MLRNKGKYYIRNEILQFKCDTEPIKNFKILIKNSTENCNVLKLSTKDDKGTQFLIGKLKILLI
jgi:hypothetical protein